MAKKKKWVGKASVPIARGPFESAVILARAGRIPEAIPLFQRSVSDRPGFTDGWINLAEALRAVGQTEAAINAYSEALMSSPGNPVVLRNLGRYLASLGRLEECLAVYEVLCAVAPQDSTGWLEYGTMLAATDQLAKAESAFRESIRLEPNCAEAYQALAIVLNQRDDAEAQLWAITNACRLNPESVEFLCGQARSLQYWGRYEEALSALENCSPNLRKAPEVRAMHALLMPLIAENPKQIADARARWMEGLGRLREEGAVIEDPRICLQMTPYYLSYQGLEERPLAIEAAEFHRECAPSLTAFRPSLERRPLNGRRLRVGFLSASLRSHSVGRVLNRFLRELDRSRVEVVNFQIPGRDAEGQQVAGQFAERNVSLNLSPQDQLRRVAEERCDVIINPEHALLPVTYYHAFARVAPIQCVTWGHPGTTGISTIDHWISWERWDPAANEARYSENLIRLTQPPMIVDRVQIPERYWSRDELGLPEGRRLYVCPQTLFKFHPHFDDLLIEILRKDERAVLVFIDGHHIGWNELLLRRWRRLQANIDGRVVFLPKLKYDRYLSLLVVADVVLDTLYFGGGTSFLDAVAVGAPVVTLPSEAMQSRMTAAFYEEMGVVGLTAKTGQEYVEIACRVAQDNSERHHLSSEIVARGDALFDKAAVALELMEILLEKAAQIL